MYKLNQNGGVTRLADNANIPARDENRDWRAYQAWLAEGNTPHPADPKPAPVDYSDTENLDRTLKALALCIAQVGGLTVPQMKQLFKQKFDHLG